MRSAVILVLGLASCDAVLGEDEPKLVEFTTPLGVHVKMMSDLPFQYTAEDVDAAFEATTIEAVGCSYAVPTCVQPTMEVLAAQTQPEVEFVASLKDVCTSHQTVTAEYTQDQHGCYLRSGDNVHIVVEILSDEEVSWMTHSECVAVRTRLAHFAAHFAQEALGYEFGHDPPLFGVWGEDIDLKTQRWFYRSRCGY